MGVEIQHTDLAGAVTESLRAAITTGELVAGERLVETELASRFGVSRGPIRDALAELEHSGLVEVRARKGSFVRSLTATDVDEVYSLRTALETLAVKRAAARGVDAAEFDRLLDELDGAHRSGDRATIGAADMALHRAIVAGADHARLSDAWEQLADQTLLLMTRLSGLAPGIQDSTGSHRDVVDRLLAGDGEAAAEALAEHLAEARAVIAAGYDG